MIIATTDVTIKIMEKKIDYSCFGDMSFEYLVAALTLWQQLMESPMTYNPIRFLLRHSIELSLKGLIIKHEQENGLISSLSEIKVSGKRLDTVHSIKKLWTHLCNIELLFDDKDKKRITDIVNKLENSDATSTKYRYPIDHLGKKTPLEPVSICWDDIAPDLKGGIPHIVIENEKTGYFRKGSKAYRESISVFEVATLLVEKL